MAGRDIDEASRWLQALTVRELGIYRRVATARSRPKVALATLFDLSMPAPQYSLYSLLTVSGGSRTNNAGEREHRMNGFSTYSSAGEMLERWKEG